MPKQATGSLIKRHAAKVVVVIRVGLLALLLAFGLVVLADWANLDVFALAE